MRRKLFVLTSFVLVLLVLTSATNAQVDNLVQYPSFEENDTVQQDSSNPFRFGGPNALWGTWAGGGKGAGSKAEIVETESIHGSRSLRVEPKGTMPGHLVVYYNFFPAILNEKYTVSFWAKAKEPRPLVTQFKSKDNSISWGRIDFQLTTEWAEYSFTAEALNTEVKLELLCASVEVPFWLDFVYVYEGEYVTGIHPTSPRKASNPNPVDGVRLEQTWTTLSWRAGNLAASHDVYLGDNFDDVNDGTGDTFRGNQATTYFVAGSPGFPYPDGFVHGTTYYWRIDEVNETEPNSPWIGNVWSFTVPPKTAYNPVPADGAQFLQPDVELSWAAGFGAMSHILYVGEDFDEVNTATDGITLKVTNYTPVSLQLAKTYYWRVDEFDGTEMHKGDVWSFTVADYLIDLVHHWTLDVDGTDVVGGLNGTVQGPVVVPGMVDNGMLFDGQDDSVEFTNFEPPRQGTVVFWMNAASVGSRRRLLGSVDQFEAYVEKNGSLENQFFAGGLDCAWSKTLILADTWYHVAMTYDLESTLQQIYINGELDVESATADDPWDGGAFAFGHRAGLARDYYSGILDDVRYYNKVLTEEKIRQLMN